MLITLFHCRNAPTILMGAMSGAAAAIISVGALPAALMNFESKIEASSLAAVTEEARAMQTESFMEEERQAFKDNRDALLTKTLILRIPDEIIQERGENLAQTIWTVPLFDHPEWIIIRRNKDAVGATVDPKQLRSYIEKEIFPVIPRAEHIVIASLPKEGETRALLEGSRMDGWRLDGESAAEQISNHISDTGMTEMVLPVMREVGTVKNETEVDLGDLTLLSRGRSNFSGSENARKFNVKKALREHVYGALIESGEIFSFNALLDGPVETWTGWAEALGIFNGIDLNPTAGGGICQASTTVYRAAVFAGLPILEHRNHSLYVKYYGAYGEGLDATVYPGQQDLTFLNDTPGALLFLAWTDGDEATVEIYGTPDGRTVTLDGPYRSWNAPKEIRNHPSLASPLWGNTIGWLQRITRKDGSSEERMLTSIYTSEIPVVAPRNSGIVTINAM